MEMNHEYASKGVAGAGLGTGIAGLSLGVLNSLGGLGALSGMFGRRYDGRRSGFRERLSRALRGEHAGEPL